LRAMSQENVEIVRSLRRTARSSSVAIGIGECPSAASRPGASV
jgi:hypothetical protein